MNLPCAILAGGLATRLGPLAKDTPKALLDVCGEPFLGHQLRLLRENGIERAVVCAGHLGEAIEARVGDGRAWGVRVEYSFDGPRLLGTAGALRRALPRLGDAFFVLYGDSYLQCDWRAVGHAFARSGKAALMTVVRNEDRWDASNVAFEGGRIHAYSKRRRTPEMRHADYGLGVLSATVLADLAEGEHADLAAIYEALAACGDLAAFEVHERFWEIGSAQGLEETRRHLAQGGLR